MVKDSDLSEIIEAFRGEAHELLQGISEALLKHEKTTKAKERSQAIGLAFRHAHNIKGAASSLGLGRVEKIVHKVEDVFAALRDGNIEASPELMDRILAALDVIEELVVEAEPGMDELSQRDRRTADQLSELLGAAPDSAQKPPEEKCAQPESSAGPEEQAPAAKEERATAFVRVSQHKLDTLLAQLGELVEMKIRMEEVHKRVQGVEEELGQLENPDLKLPRKPLQTLARGIEQDIMYLSKLLGEVQDELLELRMVPISSVFPVLRRAVRDVCRKRGIKVNVVLEGGDYELDRKIVEEIKTPLVHLLRNAVDHGIEAPKERRTSGKQDDGNVTLQISHQGNSIHLRVQDDGKGVDYQDIYRRAQELGWYKPKSAEPSQAELTRLMFSAGMSTTRKADTISGRGVGLSVVKKAVENLRGIISIESAPGIGTTFNIALPLTLATDSGLFVIAGGSRFVIPRTSVRRVVAFESKDVSVTNDVANLWYNEQHVPLARLEPSLNLSRYSNTNGHRHMAVILSSAEALAAIVVDEVEAESEIVVRDLGSFVQRLKNVSGLTITASGEMYFVLNPSDLVQSVVKPLAAADVQLSTAAALGAMETRDTTILVVDDSVTTRMLNQKFLSASGFRVVTASNGRAALEMLQAQPCDLVLSDVQMPQMDGYELTRQIRKDPQLANIPVILLTALDGKEDKERGIEAGAEAYLLKRELSQAELVGLIDQLV